MALFGKKKTEAVPQTEKKEQKAVKAKPVVAKEAPTPAPAKKATSAKAPAKKATDNQRKPMSKPSSAKPAVKPAVKAKKSTAKTAKTATVKSASKPATRVVTSRPFFVTTEEDIREAFNQAIAEADMEIAKHGNRAVGKYEFNLEVDGYHFYLIANNGQTLFDSPSFTTLIGALNGIKAFKKAVSAGNYAIRMDKYGRFRFIFANKYYGENYDAKDKCVKSAESVQNFADNSKIIFYKPDKEALITFESAKNTKRSPQDINWAAIEQAEKEAQKLGKFEISPENGEFCFYLTANNGQILYSSRYYANEAACRKGVDSFKRAAYIGNFFVDRDKFGHYRFVLKNVGSAPSFIGESYESKAQCEKIIDSVKKFIVTASIELSEETVG